MAAGLEVGFIARSVRIDVEVIVDSFFTKRKFPLSLSRSHSLWKFIAVAELCCMVFRSKYKLVLARPEGLRQ